MIIGPDFLSQVTDAMERKGYVFFTRGLYNINLIGIRGKNRYPGRFDDIVGIVFRNGEQWVQRWFPATTDSGEWYLRKPLNKNGTAILLENQYPGAYKVGVHGRTWASGGYKAMEQKSAMAYTRDNNRDGVLDFMQVPGQKVVNANLKTNIHRAHKSKLQEKVGKYSAGCQVLKFARDLDFITDSCEKAIDRGYKNSFTYTLLNDHDIR